MSEKKPFIDPKTWKALEEARKKAKQNPDAPKKESSGDRGFDEAMRELLKRKPKK